MALDPKIFDDLAKKLADAVPSSVKELQDDVERNFHAILQNAFNKLDLVTREEFEVQTQVLARTRTKVDELQQQISELENKLLPKNE